MKRLRTLSLAFLAALVVAAAPEPATVFQSEQTQEIPEIIDRARPAVVLVEIAHALGFKAHGSGLVYNSGGYILTNHHVIEGATDIRVTLYDGRTFPASVVDFYRYENADLTELIDAAVIKIEASGLATLPMVSTKPVRDGQKLIVLGYPGKVPKDKMSTTDGIASAVREGWIATDAVTMPGDSGGPVLDASGRVIGLATFITGYMYRFGGVMRIEKAMDLATQAVAPEGRRFRVINVPGIEYFMPREEWVNQYSNQFQKVWRISDGTVLAEDTEYTGGYSGARRYTTHRSRQDPSGSQDYYIDSTGFFDVSPQVDNKWVRMSSDKVPLAVLPLNRGQAWEVREEWRAKNVPAHRPGDPLPADMMRVYRQATIESLEEVVTVPAGSYQNCVKIVVESVLTPNQGDQEHSVITTWYASGVGAVRILEETSRATGTTRMTKELESVNWIR